jgi:Mib-herc2 protein
MASIPLLQASGIGTDSSAPAVSHTAMHDTPVGDVVGKTVERGRDWEWGDQDGGVGGKGRVVEASDSPVRVCVEVLALFL